MEINLFQEDVSIDLPKPEYIIEWIQQIIQIESPLRSIVSINYIFCSDEYLHDMNVSYLDHDTFTDIITFDNSDNPNEIEGDIFISVDRIEENSAIFDTPFNNELFRVMAHGLLHLLGENDKTEEEKLQMRKKEEACLSLLP